MTEYSGIERTVKEVLDKYTDVSDRLAVGVSGGEDSMCLLSVLIKIRDKKNLVAVHVQHGIRGDESLSDALFVERFCLKNGVEFLRFDVDVPLIAAREKTGTETIARIYRHKALGSLIESKRADYVVLAHHRDDQTESVLMHVLRGSGASGLVGMKEKDGFILRPLLGVPKERISAYVKAEGIDFCVDSTNTDTVYNRNFVRREIIPLIKKRYDVDSATERLSLLAEADDTFIYSLVSDDDFFIGDNECSFGVDHLKKPYALSSRYVMKAAKYSGLVCDVEKKHVDAVIALADVKNGSEIDLPHGYRAVKEYRLITVYKKRAANNDEIPYAVGITPFAEGYVNISSAPVTFEKGRPVFDGDKIPDGAIVRFRRAGDVFKPFGGGTKKLKEYFIDEKVPKRFRDFIPLVCVGNKVLCVCGMEISDEIKVTGQNCNCLKFTYDKE